MGEIGNFYEPYRRAQREREVALSMLHEAKEREQHLEQLVAEGKMRKVITRDPYQRLISIRYEEV